MPSVASHLLRACFVTFVCAVGVRAAAGTPVVVDTFHANSACAPRFAEFSLTSASQAGPGDPVYLGGIDESGNPVAVTLVTSTTGSARKIELRATYNLVRAALELSRQETPTSQRLSLANWACDDTYDIHGAYGWSYRLDLGEAFPRQVIVKLTAPGIQYRVQGYEITFGGGNQSGTYAEGAVDGGSISLAMGEGMAPLVDNLLQAVALVGNVRNGWPYVYLISSATQDLDRSYVGPDGAVTVFADLTGRQTHLLMSVVPR
jgi:hypothetical protein